MTMRWEEIAGHGDNIAMLKNMLAKGRVPHALLFAGPAGVGKMLTARVLAAALLCGATGDRPCSVCPSCRQAAQGSHPDLVTVAADGASLKIDQIRALQQEAALAPYYGGARVFLVEEAQRLTAEAANSLLKILEEPPAGTVFVLTATSSHALLPTIVSRCRLLKFAPLPVDTLSRLLVARGAAEGPARVAARLSGGRTGEALALLEPDGLTLRDKAVAAVAAVAEGGAVFAAGEAAVLDKLPPAELTAFFRHLTQVLRDIMVIHSGQQALVFNQDIVDKLTALAAVWQEAGLEKALTAVKEAGRAIEGNANSRLTCEAMLIQLMEAAKEGI
jgi:DNA polymerase-3 subunit delta'